MVEKTTTLRLRSVRFKSGGSLSVLRPKADTEVRDSCKQACDRLMESSVASNMTGWSLVAWSNDEVFVNFQNGARSTVPAAGLPQHVKDILLAEQAGRWVRNA